MENQAPLINVDVAANARVGQTRNNAEDEGENLESLKGVVPKRTSAPTQTPGRAAGRTAGTILRSRRGPVCALPVRVTHA